MGGSCETCGRQLPPAPARGGRAPKYCGATCRKAGQRARARTHVILNDAAVMQKVVEDRLTAQMSKIAGSLAVQEPSLPSDPTSALAVLLLELLNVSARMRQLSGDLPPRLRARVQRLHLVIEQEQARWFPEVK